MKFKRLAGFTFLELIFAITVMGMLFSIAITVVIGMIRFYTFTNTVRSNQESARNIFEIITKDASGGQVITPAAGGTSSSVCIKSANEVINYQLSTTGVLTRSVYARSDSLSDCNSLAPSTATSVSQLSGDKMYISTFSAEQLKQGAPTVTYQNVTSLILKAKFITASSYKTSCSSGDIYCNVFELNTAVRVSK